MINLEKKHLEMIQGILSEHVPNITVWAYGSRVKGNSHEGSDLDLVLLSDSRTSMEKISILRDAFRESDIPIFIDILDWQSIPDSFKQEIKKKHFVLQK